MRFFIKVALVLVAVSTDLTLSFAEKRALVFAVGRYEDPSWPVISSVNDLRYVGAVLKAGGFRDIVVLKDSQATKAAMLKAFSNLASRCRPGDEVYIHFSGHGQQVTDVDGDEDDGWDEAWIPYDAYMLPCALDDGSRHLVDDEINALLHGIRQSVGPEGRILVIADACHSGGSSRRDGDVELPPHRGTDIRFRIDPTAYRPASAVAVAEEWALVSACRDYQVNWEMTEPRAGRLTYCIYMLRDRLAFMNGTDVIEEIASMMERMQSPLPQDPVLGGSCEGDLISRIFKRK